ncbi:MAG: hypothetical protein U1D99_06680, partial [Candidatus Omnitrophota bacterium]|nr:hypothetical protein [Candidatus Omnitrophota bacterium]
MLKKYLVVVMTMGWSVFSAGICGAAEEGPKAAQPAEMSADLPAEVILDKVKVQYQSLKTYQAKGRVSFRMTFQGKSNDQETDYTMALGRPDFFKVVWTQEAAGQKHQGSAWNAGEGTFIYMGTGDIYAELKSGEMALGAAAGISGGSTNMIPPLFFNKRSLLGNLSNSHIERKEAVNGEECYVVTADSKSLQQKITLWISTKRLLILRSEYPLGKMSGAAENLTDQDIEEALKSMGEDVTEANKSRMKALMATQMKMAEGMNMEGKITEEISDIETDIPFSAKGFAFALPDTAQRRDSMFNFSLSEMEEMSTSMEAFGGTNVDDPQAQELE